MLYKDILHELRPAAGQQNWRGLPGQFQPRFSYTKRTSRCHVIAKLAYRVLAIFGLFNIYMPGSQKNCSLV